MKIKLYYITLLLLLSFNHMFGQVDLKYTNVTCNGLKNGTATLTIGTAPGPYKINWKKSERILPGYKDKMSVQNLRPGYYSVDIEDKNECLITKVFQIIQPAKLKLTLDREGQILPFCEKLEPFYITATPSGGLEPYDCNNCMQKISGPGRYNFSVTDSNKCVAKATIGVVLIRTFCSSDPNDIIGPDGVDSCRWMSGEETYNYTIRFENDPLLATAPAQLIFVEYPIDPRQNGFSLNIGSFGWGEYTFEVPANINTYQKRLDFVNEYGFYIDVLAGLNVNNNTVFWRFETIDPNTGLRPIDPLVGFLPINDSLTGIGEGFVAFSMKPNNNVQTGDTISASAEIVFDLNESIVTNIWINKVDAVAPNSALAALPNSTGNTSIRLQWTGTDDAGGSGIDFYRIYASENGSSFIVAGDQIRSDSFIFNGIPGATYDFYVQAVDRVGNKESKSTAEQSIAILDRRSLSVYPIDPTYVCQNDSFYIQWTSSQVDFIDIEFSADHGTTYSTLHQNIAASDSTFRLFASDLIVDDSLKLRIVDSGDPLFLSETPPFIIVQVPDVNAGMDIEMCYLDAVYLNATGANDYVWSHGSTLSDSTDNAARIYADQTTMYLLEGTDVNGCVGMDAVTVTVHLPDNDTLDVDICIGDSIYGGGGYQSQSGVYSDTFQNEFGCDSMVTQVVNQIDPCVWNQGPYVYVDLDATGARNGANWMDAFLDIQNALHTVRKYVDAKEIWIAEGEYRPGESLSSTYEMSDSIKMYGGFSGIENNKSERPTSGSEVVLSGEAGPVGWNGNNYHVVTIDTSCTDCVINGLRITAGNANGAGVNESLAAGVLIFGKLDLNEVTISGNRTQTNGAVYLIGSAANLSLIDSHIQSNTNIDGNSFFNTLGTQIFIGSNSSVE